MDEVYQQFLKALEGNFAEFVQNDAVNTYLQTIGSAVKREEVQEGMLHEFLVVSGYESERGHWAACYDNQIRFGDELLQVSGLDRTLILTPNFFYGKNQVDEEVEYRLGLAKGDTDVHVFPVVLQKAKEGQLKTIVLEDLCVVHRGLSIDPETAEVLEQESIAGVTAYQLFLSCFWNIDDYLRKQNPHFASDFKTRVWEAVEVFSDRIIEQMVYRISDSRSITGDIKSPASRDPKWVIAQIEEINCQRLIRRVVYELSELDTISEAQVTLSVRNLCAFVTMFQNYRPLKVLAQKKLNIIPYIVNNLIDQEEGTLEETVPALKCFISLYPQAEIDYLQGLVIQYIQLSTDKSPHRQELVRLIRKCCIYAFYLDKTLPVQMFKIALEDCQRFPIVHLLQSIPYINVTGSKEFWESMIKTLDTALRNCPQLSDQIIDAFQNESQELALIDLSVKLFFYMAETGNYSLIGQFIQRDVNIFSHIIRILRDLGKEIRASALKVYHHVLTEYPHLVNQQIFNFTLQKYFIVGIWSLETVLQKFPQFVEPALPLIYRLFSRGTFGSELLRRVARYAPDPTDKLVTTFKTKLLSESSEVRVKAIFGIGIIAQEVPLQKAERYLHYLNERFWEMDSRMMRAFFTIYREVAMKSLPLAQKVFSAVSFQDRPHSPLDERKIVWDEFGKLLDYLGYDPDVYGGISPPKWFGTGRTPPKWFNIST